MNQKTVLLSLLLMTAIIYSCSKDNTSVPAPTPSINYPNYSHLKTGNYWVYEQFKVDSLGNATAQNIFDSCYIAGDTVVKGKKYAIFVKPYFESPFLPTITLERDSLHYIVNENGERLFSSQDYSNNLMTGFYTTIFDTVYKIVRKMTDKNTIFSTQAGSFSTSDAQDILYMYPSYSYAGNIRYMHTRYSENVGIVTETLPFYISLPYYYERRLVRYHIN